MAIEIFEYSVEAIPFEQMADSFDLWWGDLDEAGVESVFIAEDGDMIIGFETVSADGLCVAIEVVDDYLGQGVATQLVKESGCYRPENDCSPEFWGKMQTLFGEEG